MNTASVPVADTFAHEISFQRELVADMNLCKVPDRRLTDTLELHMPEGTVRTTRGQFFDTYSRILWVLMERETHAEQ